MWSAISVTLTLLLKFCDGHFTVAAVENQGKPLSVVQKVERSGILDLVMSWAYSQFISDAVTCAHQLGVNLVSQLVSRLYEFCS